MLDRSPAILACSFTVLYECLYGAGLRIRLLLNGKLHRVKFVIKVIVVGKGIFTKQKDVGNADLRGYEEYFIKKRAPESLLNFIERQPFVIGKDDGAPRFII